MTIDDLHRIVTLEDPQLSPDERWVACVYVTVDKLENNYKRHLWLVPTGGGAPVQITRGGADFAPRWSPDGKWLLFTSVRGGAKPQLYLLPMGDLGGEAFPLTDMPNGAGGGAWSADSARIAFLSAADAYERAQERGGTARLPPADKLEARHRKEQREAEEARRLDPYYAWRIPYRDGFSPTAYYMDGRSKQIYVIEAREGAKPTRLTDAEVDFSEPVWTPDGASLITTRPPREGMDEPWRHEVLYRLDIRTRALTRLTTEPYINKGFLIAPGARYVVAPDKRYVAYLRTPQQRLYTQFPKLAIVPVGGGAERELTSSLDRTVLDAKWSAASDALFFRANSEGNTEIYRVPLEGGAIEKAVSGIMECIGFDVGASGGIAYVANTADVPTELYWRPAGASESVRLTFANGPLLDEVIVQPTHEIRFHSHDGWGIQGWYVLPVGYEAGRRYPMTVHIHGGPRVMWGPGFRTMWHESQVHAAHGYVVFYCNARGSDGYGQVFQDHSFGVPDFPDQMAGVDRMIELGIADPDKLAVTGGSYGGYMTAWITGHTDRFKAAVAQRGVFNLLSFYGTTDITAFTTDEFGIEPWQNPNLLWERSPLAYAHHIRTPILIIHGENDYRVSISESEQLFAYVRASGGTATLMRLPRESHDHSRSGEPLHRVQRLEAMFSWFDRYLGLK
jgi:dipeptidyl aminopeptidase/acylaminoacyl peptidase